MRRNIIDIAWLAGLLEGEGCFRVVAKPATKGGLYKSFSLKVNSTDEDIIRRAGQLLHRADKNILVCDWLSIHRPENKVQYEVSIHGKFAIQWMMTLYPFMGLRRKAKIRQIIREWKEYKAPIWQRKRSNIA